jgi:hypothetical protein
MSIEEAGISSSNIFKMTIALFFLAMMSAYSESSIFVLFLLDVVFLFGINILFFATFWSFIYKSEIKTTDFLKSALEIIIISFSNIFIFTSIYRYLGVNGSDVISHNFSDCLYFSMVTWTTLGYGDFSTTKGARFFAASEALLGYIYMAALIGVILPTIVSKLQNTHTKSFKQDK